MCSAEMARRIATRRLTRTDPSGADLAVLGQQLQHMDPMGAEEQAHVIAVDTTQPDAESAVFAALRTLMRTAWILPQLPDDERAAA